MELVAVATGTAAAGGGTDGPSERAGVMTAVGDTGMAELEAD